MRKFLILTTVLSSLMISPVFASTEPSSNTILLNNTSSSDVIFHNVTINYIFDVDNSSYKTVVLIDGNTPVLAHELSNFLKIPTDIVDKI